MYLAIAVKDGPKVKLVAEKSPGIELAAKIQTAPINASVKVERELMTF